MTEENVKRVIVDPNEEAAQAHLDGLKGQIATLQQANSEERALSSSRQARVERLEADLAAEQKEAEAQEIMWEASVGREARRADSAQERIEQLEGELAAAHDWRFKLECERNQAQISLAQEREARVKLLKDMGLDNCSDPAEWVRLRIEELTTLRRGVLEVAGQIEIRATILERAGKGRNATENRAFAKMLRALAASGSGEGDR